MVNVPAARILVIDDNPDVVDILGPVLRMRGTDARRADER